MSSSDPQTNDESVSSASDKLYHVAAECTELHDGRELLNRIYSINIDVLFNLLFTKSDFLLEFLKSRNFENVDITDWIDKTSKDNISQNAVQPSDSRCSNAGPSQPSTPRSSKILIPRSSKSNDEDENKKSSFLRTSQSSNPRTSKLLLRRLSKSNDDDENKKSSEENQNNIVNAKNADAHNNEEQNKKDYNNEDHENSNIKKIKTVKYVVNSSVGSSVNVTNEMVILKCSVPNELYSINELSSSKGVLYSDTFIINVHYCLMRISQERTKFLVYGNIKFIKNLISFTRNIVESQVWGGLNEHYKQLHIRLQTYSTPTRMKRRTFSVISLRRKRSRSRTIRIKTPESSYETADDDKATSNSTLGITKSLSSLKKRLTIKTKKQRCINSDTSEDCDEINVDDNLNNNNDDYLRKIWNDYVSTNTGLGILIAIGITIICFLRR